MSFGELRSRSGNEAQNCAEMKKGREIRGLSGIWLRGQDLNL